MSSDSSGDSSSEQKSSTVCFLCRQRKTRCDRNLPRCGFCRKAKVDCRYVEQPKKRGLRAGYVTELENRIDQLEKDVVGLRSEAPLVTLQTPASHTPFPGSYQTPASLDLSIFTAESTNANRTKRRRLNTESDGAVQDLISLPPEYLYSLVDLWFKENHTWCPILSQAKLQRALANLPTPVTHIDHLELRAVISLEIAYSTQAICLGYRSRRRLSQYLRSQVLTEALSSVSYSAIRSLIIIALLDYGDDNIPSTFSLMAVCRRTCEHVGLFRKLLSQIELESPAKVGPPSKETTGDEEMTIPLTWATLALDAVSSLGVSWRDVSAALVDHLSSVAYVSTPDLRDSYKAHTHLAAIGLQPVHTFIHDHEQACRRHELINEDTLLTKCDEIYHNLMGYVLSQPSNSYTLLANGIIDFDPNLVYTSVLSHASVIVSYQRLVNFDDKHNPPTITTPSPTPNNALGSTSTNIPLERCLQACHELVLSIRNMSDTDAELSTPLLSHFFFVAARFKLIMYRALSQAREIEFDTLMHGISMNARRWPVARRLDIVLRKAIAELDEYNQNIDEGDESSNNDTAAAGAIGRANGDVMSGFREVGNRHGISLPKDFWELKKTHLDISEQLKGWVIGNSSLFGIGSLNGPYAYHY